MLVEFLLKVASWRISKIILFTIFFQSIPLLNNAFLKKKKKKKKAPFRSSKTSPVLLCSLFQTSYPEIALISPDPVPQHSTCSWGREGCQSFFFSVLFFFFIYASLAVRMVLQTSLWGLIIVCHCLFSKCRCPQTLHLLHVDGSDAMGFAQVQVSGCWYCHILANSSEI